MPCAGHCRADSQGEQRPSRGVGPLPAYARAGLSTGVLYPPLLPGVTDTGRALDGMAKRAKEAGASFSAPSYTFLNPVRSRFTWGVRPGAFSLARAHVPAALR